MNAKGKKGLIATTRFFDDKQGRRLYRKAKELYMPNWSIEWEPIPGGNFPVKGGTRHDKWRLLAYSLVKLGMNEDATADAGLKFLIQEQPVHGRRTTLAAEVGARVAHAALVTAHECLVAAMHAKCHDAACADAPEEIADRLVSEHAPILKEHIADFVSCYRVLAAERPCKSLIEFTAMFGRPAPAIPATAAAAARTTTVALPGVHCKAADSQSAARAVDPAAITAGVEAALEAYVNELSGATVKG